MGNWSDHGSATGGYYQCNLYEEKKKDANFAAKEAEQKMAVSAFERYSWHIERYWNHEKSRKLAIKQCEDIQTVIQLLHDFKNYPPSELVFLTEGYEAIIKCRVVLSFTYAHSFFCAEQMPELRKALFQQWQSDLERYCDHLHGLCEKDL